MMENAAAREHATRQWTAHPCGAVAGDLSSLAYFTEVERSRYAHQPWQKKVIGFDRYRDRNVLEIGVGLGTDLAQFAKAGAICHAIDITERHLEAAARNFEARGLPVVLKKCDATQIDFADGYFDLVYSFGVIHHIPDASKVVQEIRRVLKPGGKVLVTLYHRYSFFHFFMLFVRGLLFGQLFRLGYDGLWRRSKRERTGWRSSPTSSCTAGGRLGRCSPGSRSNAFPFINSISGALAHRGQDA